MRPVRVATLDPDPSSRGAVQIAVVIPAYRQPGLLPEALTSIVRQRADFPIGAVVVDDGCPMEETRTAALSFARNLPGRICYVRTRNGGLSAARNTGVAFALQAWPETSALFMLDSDNRLEPDFLARAHAILRESPPDVGWIYSDFDMLGMPLNHSTQGRYSALMHLVENYCDAGSLIRREVFEAGARFNETMRTGQEDWDFWLQALEAGFRGRHLPASGFRYRRRIESMLSDSDAARSVTLAKMRERHRSLFHPRAVVARAQQEMPDFAVHAEDGQVWLTPDPAAPGEGRRAETAVARQELLTALQRPAAAFFPPVTCFADAASLEALRANKLVRNVFWRAQLLLRDHRMVTLTIRRGEAAQLGLEMDRDEGEDAVAAAQLIFLRSEDALARLDAAGRAPAEKTSSLVAIIPAEAAFEPGLPRSPTPAERLEAEVGRLKAQAGGLAADWRKDNRLHRSAQEVTAALTGCRTLYPHRKRKGVKDFGVVLPRCEFGGIERGKGNYAAVLAARGWRPHLFVTKTETAYLSAVAFDAYESVNFVTLPGIEKHHPEQQYFGMWTSGLGKQPEADDLVGLLGGMDAVINNHSFAMHAVAGRLRRSFGVHATVGVHMTERTPAGNPLGTPHSILGYEHAYDGVIVISDMLRQWCVGQGVPAEKLHLVRNAPSYPPGPGAVTRSLRARRRRTGPLNVLFLGRLDRQKGLDRLAEVIRRTRGGAVTWRLVGKAVLEDAGRELDDIRLEIEPPVHAAEDLDALYAWADVMILTSRFEGVPLSILEAQRAGCVALSTDVGAVREIVAHGVDGLIVSSTGPEEAIVSAFCGHIERLAGDRRLTRAIGLRAARRASRNRWSRNLQDWVVQLEAACEARDPWPGAPGAGEVSHSRLAPPQA